MSNGPVLTAEDAKMIRKLIAENPQASCPWVASKMGRHRSSILSCAKKFGIVFPKTTVRIPVRLGGVLGKLISEIDEKYQQTEVAHQLQVDRSTYSLWRAGKGQVPYYAFEALAELAGYEIVLRKKGTADVEGENELAIGAVEASSGAGSAGIPKAAQRASAVRR